MLITVVSWRNIMIYRYILTLSDAVFSVIEFILALRILLKLLGANTAAPFVRWLYATSQPLLTPFEGIFPSAALTGGFTLEASALFALLAYGFLGFLLQSVIIRLIPHYHPHNQEAIVEEEVAPRRVIRTKRR